MATPSGTVMPGLNAAWTAYRTWAATARHHKAEIDFWNRWGLSLAVAGAVLAALGEQLAPLAPPGGPFAYVLRAPGVLAAAVIALAAYFSAQGLAAHRDRLWIRCRAAAESIKSAIYLYRASVSPFDTPARTAEIRQARRDPAEGARRRRGAPAQPGRKGPATGPAHGRRLRRRARHRPDPLVSEARGGVPGEVRPLPEDHPRARRAQRAHGSGRGGERRGRVGRRDRHHDGVDHGLRQERAVSGPHRHVPVHRHAAGAAEGRVGGQRQDRRGQGRP